MDVWLIVNLFVPFVEVLLHTFIDSFRDEPDRQVNHHGSNVPVGDSRQDILHFYLVPYLIIIVDFLLG